MHPHVAWIREEDCIGCTKCIAVCPTDAIVGAAGFTHTVIADLCIACDLCLPPCPVNCIDLVSVERDPASKKPAALLAKARIQSRLKRLAREQEQKLAQEHALRSKTPEEKKAEIAAALARANQKNNAGGDHDA